MSKAHVKAVLVKGRWFYDVQSFSFDAEGGWTDFSIRWNDGSIKRYTVLTETVEGIEYVDASDA